MPTAAEFKPTSIGESMTFMLRDIHARRGIAIFSGPPGIGKTTAIEAFAAEHDYQVPIVKPERGRSGCGARMAIQEMIKAMWRMSGKPESFVHPGTLQVKEQLAWELRDYAGDHSDELEHTRLTFVFDEAQNLARDAIDTFRLWNDRDRCYGPFPIGLAFVGNAEFALDDSKGKSVISASMADRALYTEQFTYADVENADITMILKAHGVADELVIAAMLKRMDNPRLPRSLRRLVDVDLPRLRALAGDDPVTLETMRTALAA